MKEYLDSQIDRTKRYKENIEEERNYGKPKNYFCLPKKLAEAVFRGRADIIDPTPRKPHEGEKWKCKFCDERKQTTRHYIDTGM